MTNLVTVEELKVYMPIRPNDTSNDAQLIGIIAGVSQRIETACRIKFSASVFAEIMDVPFTTYYNYDFYGNSVDGLMFPGSAMFRLMHSPVDTNASFTVKYDPSRLFDDGALISSENVILLADRGIVYINHHMVQGSNVLRFDYTAGSTAPDEVKSACIEQCLYEFKRMGYDNVGMDSPSCDDKSGAKWAVASGLLPTVASKIAPYRRLLRGRK